MCLVLRYPQLYPEYPIGIAKRISYQIACGLEYLHSRGIVHGGMTFTYQYFVCLMERITDLHPKNIHLPSPLGLLKKRYTST